MKTRVGKVVLMFVTMAACSAFAQSTATTQDGAKPADTTQQKVGSGPNPFSDCGIGAALFKDVSWAAVTSNIIWDLGTTAVTSATLSPQTCSKQSVKAALLIRDTYAQVVEEAARGNGAHLSAALELFSCQAASQPRAIQEIRSGIGSAISNPSYNGKSPIEKASDLYNIFDQAAQQNCSV